MLKRNICVLFLILLMMSLVAGPVNAAESGIKMTIKTGYDGKIKTGRGFPLFVTLENKGDDFKGDLLFSFYPSYNSSGAQKLEIDLAKGAKKTFSVSLPGYTEDMPFQSQNHQSIHLYKGDWENDEEVDYDGPKNLKLKFIDMMKNTIGVLSEDPDRLKELKVLSAGQQLEVLTLDEQSIPTDVAGLNMLDYILIDEFAVSSLDDQQQKALKEWVEKGGVLIAGAAPDAKKSYGVLYDLLPMETESEARLSSAYFQVKPEVKTNFKDVTTFTGKIKPGSEVVAELKEFPVVVKREIGAGEVRQTAFSLGDEPLSSWKGYSTWFESVLLKNAVGNTHTFKGSPNIYEPMYYEFAESNEYFDSLNFSIGELSLILLVYLLILVPVLYIILKKWDKREHAWWIIPLIAIVSSSLIFGVGARDRMNSAKINQMGVFESKGNVLKGMQALTLLSNTSGDYKMSVAGGDFSGVPGTSQINIDAQRFAVLEETRKGQAVTFPEVEYWSTRTQFGPAHKTIQGEFVSDLKFEEEKLTGTIRNEFPYDFEELYLWSGNKKIKLGRLKQGETINVDEKVALPYLTSPKGSFNNNYYPPAKQDMEKMKRERLENGASEILYSEAASDNKPVLFGYTKDSVFEIDLEDRPEIENNLFLIFQSIATKGEIKGPFTLKNEMLNLQVNPITGAIMDEFSNPGVEMMLEDGEYELIATVPKPFLTQKSTLTELGVTLKGNFITYAMFDNSTGEFVDTDTSKKTFVFTNEDLKKFINKDGQIKIKMLKAAKGEPHVYLPAITVQGEVKP